MAIDLDLDSEDLRRISLSGMPIVSKPDHINDREDAATIRKTMEAITHLPSSSSETGASLVGRAAPSALLSSPLRQMLENVSEELSTYQGQLQEIAQSEELPKPFEFPNLAWESIKAGLAQENFIHDKLNRHIDEIQKAHGDISKLLDLNAALSGLSEEKEEFPDRVRELLDQLRESGIDIQGNNVGEIKRATGSHESRLRSEIQIKFTTKVQYLMQQIESMNQILQSIIRYDSKLKEKTNQLPR